MMPASAQINTVAEPTPSPQHMVDALHLAFGDHHVRAVHAKGVMVVGVFEAAPGARDLSTAVIFRSSAPTPVLARFSDFTGIPDIPDNIGDANPRGFAVKFKLMDGGTMDVVAHSFNGFPTATSEGFRELLMAIAASGPGSIKPDALDSFLASHPIAKTFLTTQKPPPESYATLQYFGVNAFGFIDDRGHTTSVRYRFAPLGGEAFVPQAELADKGADYLQEELPARLAKGPISFRWCAQIAEPGDAVDDPSIAWPETRRLVELGTVTLTGMVPDPAQADHATMFLPLNLPDGIVGEDPMLEVREKAYPISFDHRNGRDHL
jgi:catalase